jgi:signal transduction histidine kinase
MGTEISQRTEVKAGAILVVDDMDMVLRMVCILLEKLGYRTHSASNAQDGLRILEQEAIDLIVTDVMMPECDGIAFLKEVRQRTLDVPVVLMTGSAHLDMAMEAIKNGAFDLVTKPLDNSYFQKVVEKALEHRRLVSLERNYHSELERTVAQQTMQLKEALQELDKFHSHAKSTAQERSQFLSTLTHELRTPMNGIVAPLGMLKESQLSADDRELVEIASSSAARMLQLVNQLLSFADAHKNPAAPDKRGFDLRQLCASLEKSYCPLFSAKGVVLSFSVQAEVPATVAGNRDLTLKLADILLGNALKFTESGTASLWVGIKQGADQQPALQLRVSDSGIGIAEHDLEAVFDQFFQVDAGLTRRRGGLGLGLSQAREIVQYLGGSIRVQSVLGSGSSFEVDLPLYTQ